MTRRLLALQFFLIGCAGLLWATLPQETLPSFAWRGHYGGIFLMFGLEMGIAIGGIFGRSRAPGQ